MIRYECAIYCWAIDFVLDRLRFEEPIVKNDSHVEAKNDWVTGQTIGQEQLSNQPGISVWWDRKELSNKPNNRLTAIKQPKVENEWTNNQNRRLAEAKRDWTSNQTINLTNDWEQLFGKAENDCKQLINQTQKRLQSPPTLNKVWNRWEFWIRG